MGLTAFDAVVEPEPAPQPKPQPQAAPNRFPTLVAVSSFAALALVLLAVALTLGVFKGAGGSAAPARPTRVLLAEVAWGGGGHRMCILRRVSNPSAGAS